MPIEVKNLKQIPAGNHKAIIIDAKIIDKTFKHEKGPEQVLEVTIQPEQPEEGIYNPVSVNFTPALNPLSALGSFLVRLGVAPDWESASSWDETSLIGREVTVNIAMNGRFPQALKDSIRAYVE